LKVFKKKRVKEDADEKDMGLCYTGIFEGSVEEEVCLTIEITTDITSVLCTKEE